MPVLDTAALPALPRAERVQAVDDWLAPYRQLWNRHLDALERHLDNQSLDNQEQCDD